MNEPDITKFPKYRPNPFLADLPTHLKDPKNYKKIMKAILDTLATKHSHADLFEWSQCKSCSQKMLERRLLLKNLGFRNPRQFLEWRKVMDVIQTRVKLEKYND